MFYCQKDIESGKQCKTQCAHCKEYYAPIEQSELFLVFGHNSKGKGVIVSVMAESSSQAIQNALKMRPDCKFNHANLKFHAKNN